MEKFGKRARVYSAEALAQAAGKKLWWVVLILMSIGWATDILFELLSFIFSKPELNIFSVQSSEPVFPDMFSGKLLLLLLSFFGLLILWGLARRVKMADQFDARPGNSQYKKEVMVLVLSPFSSWPISRLEKGNASGDFSKKGYSRENMLDNLSGLPEGPVESLRKTLFQNNWVPSLKSIEAHVGLKEVVVITTDGEKGSDGQCQDFERLVNQVFIGRSLSVMDYKDYLVNTPEAKVNINGISSTDMVLFSKTLLCLLGKLVEAGKESDKVVVEVTGGMGFMSAAMASVSVLNDIEIHYVNTHDLSSQTLNMKIVGYS